MTQDINIIPVFELRAIFASSTREWVQFAEIGSCYIPQVLLEEIDFLTKRAISEEEEKKAREFMRFLNDNSWQVSANMTPHPSLQPMDGDNLSKNARLQLAMAESIYYLSLENPNKLIVLVANNQNLRQEVEQIGQDNIIDLTLAQFMQWLRTKQKPINVSQKIASLSNGSMTKIPDTLPSKEVNKNSDRTTPHRDFKMNADEPKLVTPRKKIKPKNEGLNIVISTFLALGSLTVVIFLGWYLVQPKSLTEFWQKTGLPSLQK